MNLSVPAVRCVIVLLHLLLVLWELLLELPQLLSILLLHTLLLTAGLTGLILFSARPVAMMKIMVVMVMMMMVMMTILMIMMTRMMVC